MEDKKHFKYKKDIGAETFIFITIFLIIFVTLGSIMGAVNMIKTLMNTSYQLLIDVCLYILAISVLSGAISGIFSEFGVIALINKFLSKIMKPIYDMPGASSLGILNCYLSDNPAILTLAKDDNFRCYFKKYQIPALTNLGTSFGMGVITTTAMMSLGIEGAIKSALIGNLGAIAGSIVSVRLMLSWSKKYYGTNDMVVVENINTNLENVRLIRDGNASSRFIASLLDGGRVGVEMGVSIIPGVLIICSLVSILTNGPSELGTYTGAANEGIAFLPWLGAKLNFILSPIFGFSSPEAIAIPITALGSTGAAIALVSNMSKEALVSPNDIAVFTAICMCWSGYISTHIAMMDALDTKEATGRALVSHTIGGLFAGFFAHILFIIIG